jgi:predicted kinase
MTQAFVMVGPPGAGKTTHSRKLAKEHHAVIISGDDIRSEFYGDASIQGSWDEIWSRMDELVAENCYRSIVVDGTHCRPDYRAETLTLLRSYGYTDIHAIVVDRPLAVCLQQNRQRSRQVPEHVIRRMHEELAGSKQGIGNEGFSSVSFL